MAHTQPARGMRDFLPDDVRRREFVAGTVRRPLTDDEVAFILQSAQNYVAYRLDYSE